MTHDPKSEFVDALAQLLGGIEILAILPERIGNEQARNVFSQWRRLRTLFGMSAGYNKDEAKKGIEKFIEDFIDIPKMLRKQAD